MIVLDTSVLVESLTGDRRCLNRVRELVERGEQIALCSMVLYEWLRGPRSRDELRDQESLFPRASAFPFETSDAEIAAGLYKRVRRARTREADIAIAACAIRQNADLWTINVADFQDIPGLRLFRG